MSARRVAREGSTHEKAHCSARSSESLVSQISIQGFQSSPNVSQAAASPETQPTSTCSSDGGDEVASARALFADSDAPRGRAYAVVDRRSRVGKAGGGRAQAAKAQRSGGAAWACSSQSSQRRSEARAGVHIDGSAATVNMAILEWTDDPDSGVRSTPSPHSDATQRSARRERDAARPHARASDRDQ